MPARKNKIRHDENTRAKIQASQLINRLTNHVLGKVDMQPSQVTAALGLLKKTLPDLSSLDVNATIDDKRTPAEYSREELAEIVSHSTNGSGGTARQNGRDGSSDKLH